MWSKFLATLPLAAFVVADFDSIAEDFTDAAKEVGVEQAKGCDPSDTQCQRSFGSAWAQEIIGAINGYACWCYFQDAHGRGKGSPVNEVDAQCKILHDGYTCIMMDAEDEGKNCAPWDVKYNSATGLGMLANDGDNASLEQALHLSVKKSTINPTALLKPVWSKTTLLSEPCDCSCTESNSTHL